MKKLLRSPVVLCLVIVLVVAGLVRLWAAWSVYADLANAEAKLEEKLSYYEEENKRLRQDIRISETPLAIERDGKSRLNQKKPGEKVIVVVTSTSTEPGVMDVRSWWERFKSFFTPGG
jgi:cell division protein FtsB